MSEPGSGAFPSGSQPGTPDSWAPPAQGVPAGQAGTSDAGWAAPQYSLPVEQKKSGVRKWLSIGGSVVAVGIVGAGALGFGLGDPEVGDCVKLTGDTSFDVVDCGAGEAEYRIVGVEDEELDVADLDARIADDSVCADFPEWEYALWSGDLETEPGTVYCTEPV